jgi:hypothetical protein
LLGLSRRSPQDFQRVLERYAIERILYRLSLSDERERFVLKGAQLLTLWGGSLDRPTRDLDLLGFGDCEPEALRRRFMNILAVTVPEDGLFFNPEALKATLIREESLYGGVRLTCSALLDGAKIPVQIDVGVGDAVAPQQADFPVLLDHPQPRLLVYNREAVVAEKFQAAVKLGKVNSRMKDFYDLYQLAGETSFEGAALAAALGATFDRRQTPFTGESPACLNESFYSDAGRGRSWRAWRDAQNIGPSGENFARIGVRLIAFLRPIHRALAQKEVFTTVWPPEGPWR